MNESLAQFADSAIAILAPAILAIVGALVTAAVAWVNGKIKNQHVAAVMANVDDLAMTVIRSTYQAYVKPLQESQQWTPEAHAQAQAMAVAELKSYLGAKGLLQLEKLIGGNAGKFLEAIVNEAVHNNKLLGASSPLAPPAQG